MEQWEVDLEKKRNTAKTTAAGPAQQEAVRVFDSAKRNWEEGLRCDLNQKTEILTVFRNELVKLGVELEEANTKQHSCRDHLQVGKVLSFNGSQYTVTQDFVNGSRSRIEKNIDSWQRIIQNKSGKIQELNTEIYNQENAIGAVNYHISRLNQFNL